MSGSKPPKRYKSLWETTPKDWVEIPGGLLGNSDTKGEEEEEEEEIEEEGDKVGEFGNPYSLEVLGILVD